MNSRCRDIPSVLEIPAAFSSSNSASSDQMECEPPQNSSTFPASKAAKTRRNSSHEEADNGAGSPQKRPHLSTKTEAHRKCPGCDLCFFFKEGLIKHMKVAHPTLDLPPSPLVQAHKAHILDPKIEQYIKAIPSTNKRAFMCTFPDCNRTYTKRHICAHHVKVKHGELANRSFQCLFPNCGKRYALHNSLVRHQRARKHKSEDSGEIKEGGEQEEEEVGDQETVSKCQAELEDFIEMLD